LFGQFAVGDVVGSCPSLVIAAAGNGSTPAVKQRVQLPADAPGVVSVAALGKSSQGYAVAPFSNVNATVCAPGVHVFSAAAGGAEAGGLLRRDCGTSMAAPHVVGVAALWWEYLRGEFEENTAKEVQRQLSGCSSKKSKGFAPGVTKQEFREAVGAGLVCAPLDELL
jgi:subtilisin family serine protease